MSPYLAPMNVSATVLYDTLSAALQQPEQRQRVRALRNALNLISSVLLEEESIRFPSLFSRISYLCRTHQLNRDVSGHLQQLRIRSKNDALAQTFTDDELVFAGRALARLVNAATGSPIPDELKGELGRIANAPKQHYTGACLRAVVTSANATQLVIEREDGNDEGMEFVLHADDHPAFQSLFDAVTSNATLSLVDVRPNDARGVPYLVARMLIYEPDYVIDVSSLSACCIKLANQTVLYEGLWFVNRYDQADGSEAIFLGNLVNSFFDRMVNSDQGFPRFETLFRESFTAFPLEYLHYFNHDAQLIEFMNTKAKVQWANLERVIGHDFATLRPPIPCAEPLIEPGFISPELGLQGRLDLLHQSGDSATIVELKSGKLPWPETNPDAVNATHVAQAHLYQMLINRILGVSFRDMHVYLLYSSGRVAGSNLRYVARSVEADLQLIALRNAIVMAEQRVGLSASPDATIRLLKGFTLAGCGLSDEARIPEWFAGKFSAFQSTLKKLGAVERDYLGAFMSFIAREQWIARLGDGDQRYGHSALWRSDMGSERPDRLGPLRIERNELKSDPPRMALRFQAEQAPDHDFRRGDICVLYPSDHDDQNAVSQQVIKSYLVEEPNDKGELVLGFRNPQHHELFFSVHTKWYIEHDYLDQNFVQLQRELFRFVSNSDENKRSLILGQRRPRVGPNLNWDDALALDAIPIEESRRDLRDLLHKALNAPEYFLLVGPPGTGKTSLFLANFVRAAVSKGEQLLLLAYTNRAVDEICEAVELALGSNDGYFRIGSSSVGDPRFEDNLLHKLASTVSTRKELMALIDKRHVVVSTVSGILSRSSIFGLKRFDRMVVDEASQVIEPLLVNLLMLVPRFVLIGDDRQLPAVVQQNARCNRLITDQLKSIGLTDLRSSLFERLLRKAQHESLDHCMGTLRFQGRMHPVIGSLVGALYYNNGLHPAGKAHQNEAEHLGSDPMVGSRLVFVEGGSPSDIHPKVNPEEARIAAALTAKIIEVYGYEAPEKHIGIIAPYRNQIGRIRQELLKSSIRGGAEITVDTVERYQGSQRDHIIYCTSVTNVQQLRFLTSNTLPGIDGVHEVDRKLNVALSRARKQFAMIGQAELLSQSTHYDALIKAIRLGGVHVDRSSFTGEFVALVTPPF